MKKALTGCCWLLTLLLLGCGADVDNTEPPAELTTIRDPLPLNLNWTIETSTAINRASYRLRPFHSGNRIYSIDIEGLIVCIDAGEGKRLWKYRSGLESIAGLGGNDELLLATSRDGHIEAYRHSAEGLEPHWKIRIESEIRAVPVVDGRQVFVRSVDGKLRSLSAADGSQQWVVSQRVPALSLTGNSEPLVAGGLVFAGFDDGKLIAYERDSGEIRWETTISVPSGRTEVERLVDIDGRFVLRNGIIYVSSFQGRLAAVQASSGDLLWSREFSSYHPIAIDDDALYLSADNSDLWAIDLRTGSAFWKQDVLHARKITAPSVIGEKVVVADLYGYLHWFNRVDGQLEGRIRVGRSRSYSQPLVAGTAVVVVDKYGELSSVSLRR